MQPETILEPEVICRKGILVPMRDGVRLATDVYLPAVHGRVADGRFPAALERTAYGRTVDSRSEVDLDAKERHSRAAVAAYFVKRGYVVVYQDCRGRHDSEGGFVKYLSEATDGADTVEWIRSQPWSDGKVGTKGLSYGAHAQMALATQNPAGLSAMVLDSGGFSNAFHGGIRQGGAFELKQATWAFRRAKESAAKKGMSLASQALESEDIREWFKVMPWRRGRSPLKWAPDYEAYLLEQWQNGSFGEYWQQSGLYAEGSYDAIAHIPQVHMSSWYDVYVRTALDNFTATKRRGKAAAQLIMGPWLHGDRNATHSGNVEFGGNAAFDGSIAENWRSFRATWFDRWVKNQPNEVDGQAAVRIFLMGGGSGGKDANGRLLHGGKWIQAKSWPLPKVHAVEYFLRENARLSVDPSRSDCSYSYCFDPDRPVPTIGGALTSGAPVFEGGGFNQVEDLQFFGSRGNGLPLNTRADVVSFETEPLVGDVAVVGSIVVTLFVASDCLDTDFTAKLIDVYPPSEDYPKGYALNLTDGIIRCRYRNSWESPEALVPGQVVKVVIESFATANLFKAGHVIRLDISSSNFPKYDVNPNTGALSIESTARRIATNSIHCGADHPSNVVLPIVALHDIEDMPRWERS